MNSELPYVYQDDEYSLCSYHWGISFSYLQYQLYLNLNTLMTGIKRNCPLLVYLSSLSYKTNSLRWVRLLDTARCDRPSFGLSIICMLNCYVSARITVLTYYPLLVLK